MTDLPFQDYYPDQLSHCYGCGWLNEHGLQIKSFWQGDESANEPEGGRKTRPYDAHR
jgi:hypothetical protein